MQNDNPSHKAERLLPNDPSAPRMGAYAPPPSETMNSAVSIPSGEYNHDLYLNSSHGGGDSNEPVLVTSTLQGEDEEIHLPPLVSFIPYMRFWWTFSRWILLFLIANCISMGKVMNGYTMHYLFPINSWKGWFLAGLWLLTAVWCYVSAKVVDRQVREVEIEAHYEQGRVSENDDHVASGMHPSQMQDKVFGHVSRRLDNFLLGKQGDAPAGPADTPDSDPIHFLMNLAYALWAILFSAAVALAVATMLGTSREFPNCKNGSSSTNSETKVDVNRIGSYPESVQDWINSTWFGGSFYIRTDDTYETGPIGDPTEYDFPTSDTEGPLLTALFPDGTSFYMSNPPAVKIDSGYSTDAVLVLAEMGTNGTIPQFHTDILNPRLFLPIENTISENSKGDRVASQYCFQATPKSSTDNGNSQRNSWRSRIHTSNIYCIVYNSGSKKFAISKVMVALGDKMYYSQWRSASTGGMYLLESRGSADNGVEYREVWAVDPASMNATKVYHSTGGGDRGRHYSDDYYYDDYDFWGHDTREVKCILHKVKIPSCLIGVVCLVLCGLWLVLREGVPSGVVPIVATLVCLIRWFTGKHGFAAEALTFNAGFFFLQVALCCGQSPFRPLPHWIGRDMCLWALYAWMMAYLATDLLFGFDGATLFVSCYLVLNGILQGHPIFWIFGYLGVFVCMLTLVVGAFVGDDYIAALVGASISLAAGLALLGISSTCSKYNRYWRALSRPFRNVGRSVLYGSSSGPQGMNGGAVRSAAGAQHPDSV